MCVMLFLSALSNIGRAISSSAGGEEGDCRVGFRVALNDEARDRRRMFVFPRCAFVIVMTGPVWVAHRCETIALPMVDVGDSVGIK